MRPVTLRTSIIGVALLGVAAAVYAQGDLDRYRAQMSGYSADGQQSDGSINAAIAQWQAIQQSDGLSFDTYASFLVAHPGWPGEAATRRAAEKAAGSTASMGSVATFFRRVPPLSATGQAAFARALASTGQLGDAGAAARKAWVNPGLSPTDESYVLASFGNILTPADHDARMDALLWAGQVSTAARQLAYTSAARRGLYAARLSLRSNAGDASSIAYQTTSQFGGDAGYIADRARWLAANGAGSTARTWLAQSRTIAMRPIDTEAWTRLLLANAKAAAMNGEWANAYGIALHLDDAYPLGTDIAARSYGERDAYTDLAWLGGQAAMKHLGRPADAIALFDRYARASHSPQVHSKGNYWAGRAAEAAGQTVQAAASFAQAANYRDQFYGQLAAERAGRTLLPPPQLGPVTIDPAIRAAFNQRELVRAAKALGAQGDRQNQSLFLKAIATSAQTDTDHLLADDLSRSLGRPDLAVMVSKVPLANGAPDYTAAAFPMVSVPSGYEASWSIIHAIARQESQFDRGAVSHAGARGLMQLMPGTAREQSGKLGLGYSQAALTSDPNLSIMLGSSYFGRIKDQFGSYPLAIAAYNAGGGNVNRWLDANGDPRSGSIDMIDWIEAIPFTETRGYVERVLENAVVYDLLNPAHAASAGHQAPLSWYLGKGRPG